MRFYAPQGVRIGGKNKREKALDIYSYIGIYYLHGKGSDDF